MTTLADILKTAKSRLFSHDPSSSSRSSHFGLSTSKKHVFFPNLSFGQSTSNELLRARSKTFLEQHLELKGQLMRKPLIQGTGIHPVTLLKSLLGVNSFYGALEE